MSMGKVIMDHGPFFFSMHFHFVISSNCYFKLIADSGCIMMLDLVIQ